ncbi:hypothetical protein Bhyg_06548 [Pseudolycoriella hygida]|uniref:Uncharacterized protein n=1 Tax=Pseudolycoriella hygida TaxID=35572 RepID=A0A9Q0S2J1_9DIPT|nr:hypothetical protein Bhyg_06548 [Pseudolycoriella hygida]
MTTSNCAKLCDISDSDTDQIWKDALRSKCRNVSGVEIDVDRNNRIFTLFNNCVKNSIVLSELGLDAMILQSRLNIDFGRSDWYSNSKLTFSAQQRTEVRAFTTNCAKLCDISDSDTDQIWKDALRSKCRNVSGVEIDVDRNNRIFTLFNNCVKNSIVLSELGLDAMILQSRLNIDFGRSDWYSNSKLTFSAQQRTEVRAFTTKLFHYPLSTFTK